jgi:hypothetical protein
LRRVDRLSVSSYGALPSQRSGNIWYENGEYQLSVSSDGVLNRQSHRLDFGMLRRPFLSVSSSGDLLLQSIEIDAKMEDLWDFQSPLMESCPGNALGRLSIQPCMTSFSPLKWSSAPAMVSCR